MIKGSTLLLQEEASARPVYEAGGVMIEMLLSMSILIVSFLAMIDLSQYLNRQSDLAKVLQNISEIIVQYDTFDDEDYIGPYIDEIDTLILSFDDNDNVNDDFTHLAEVYKSAGTPEVAYLALAIKATSSDLLFGTPCATVIMPLNVNFETQKNIDSIALQSVAPAPPVAPALLPSVFPTGTPYADWSTPSGTPDSGLSLELTSARNSLSTFCSAPL